MAHHKRTAMAAHYNTLSKTTRPKSFTSALQQEAQSFTRKQQNILAILRQAASSLNGRGQ